MSAFRTLSALTAGGLALGVLAAAPAAAAPSAEVVPLTCDGTTYDVVVRGNGTFTPGHDAATGRVFVPVEFGSFTGVVRDADGVVQESFTEAAERKGRSSLRGTVVCSFEITFVGTGGGGEEDLPLGWTFTGSGTVTVKVVGAP